MTRQNYMLFLRVLGVAIAIALWGLSVQFSQEGFNIQIDDMAWVGLILALSVTGLQLIWNKQGSEANMTIMIVGLMAYLYGIWTNVTGIMTAQGVTWGSGDFGDIVFPIVLGLVLEVTPEPLIVWALIGSNFGGDFFTNLFGSTGGSKKSGSGTQNYPSNRSYVREQTKPTVGNQFKL